MDLTALSALPLFAGVTPEDAGKMLSCLSAHRRQYEKGAYIQTADQPLREIGAVLRGSVHLIREDYWGNRAILAQLGPGGIFGESCACGGALSPVSVVAAAPAEILFLDYRKVTSTCSSACPFHTALIRNMLSLLAEKNVLLTSKISHLVKRSTREKLLSYFSEQAQAAGSNCFTIPFDRQQLADYLSVDRSAMSAELGKLRREGVLDFQKNRFTLL